MCVWGCRLVREMVLWAVAVLLVTLGPGAWGRPAVIQRYCDQCECILSEDTSEPRGITNVKAKCKEGHVEWSNPYGALRVEIRPGYPGDFKGCVLINSEYTRVKVSQETRTGLKHLQTVQGVSKEICLTATSAPIMLYIELVPESSVVFRGVPRVFIDYDIERLHSKLYFDPLEDCRPCDEEELLRAYCSSDYVVEGKILHVEHRDHHEETSIEVAAHRVVQQSKKDLFTIKHHSSGHTLHGTIIAPKKCGVQQGPGMFMLMGSVKLGRMRLKCAPFLEDWERVRRAAEEDDTLECSFD